ncbi:MAG: tyrosine-type recombinase/integrase [Candidatus Baltobacteraceae bacterium]
MARKVQNLGGIRKRPNGQWEFRARVDGRRISIYAATRSALLKKVADQRARGGGELRPRNPITIDQLFEPWLESVEETRKRTTHAQYDTMYRLYIQPAIGSKRIESLDAQDIEHLYRSLKAKGVGAATIQRVHLVLSRALRVALRKQILFTDLMAGVEPPVHKAAKMRTLDRAETERFLAAISGDRYEALYLLAAIGGMRQGELFALRWSDIDFRRRVVEISQSLQDVDGHLEVVDPKTKTSARSLDFGPRIATALKSRQKAWKSEGHQSPYVFTTPTGEFLRKSNFIRREFAAVLERAGLPRIRFHDLRHTAATMMLMAEIHPKVVAERLGHASVRTTLDRYSHVVKGMGQGASEALEAFVFGPPGGRFGGTTAKRASKRTSRKTKKSP